QGAARSIKGGLEYAMFNDAISEPALDRAAGGRYGRRPAAGGRYGRRPAAGGRRGRGSEELDALRQRQLAGVVDRVRGLPHIGLPRVGAGFASAAGLLLSAEGTADLRSRGADVDVGDAAVRPRDEP